MGCWPAQIVSFQMRQKGHFPIDFRWGFFLVELIKFFFMNINIIATKRELHNAKRGRQITFFQSSPNNFFPAEYPLLSKGYRLVNFSPLLCVIENPDKNKITSLVRVTVNYRQPAKLNCLVYRISYLPSMFAFWLLI